MTTMASANSIAEIAALIGDPARANILAALMGGQALTAGELAQIAGVAAQTASGHLAKLSEAGLIVLERQQGRHRYFRLTSPQIAHVIETLSCIAAMGPKRYRPRGPQDEAMRFARVCYDHMAGQLGTALADCLGARGYVRISDGSGVVSDSGRRFFCDFGIDLEPGSSRRPLCRTCLDWSERRPHLAGRLGAAILNRLLDLDWIARMPEGRALRITEAGHAGFSARFGIVSTGYRENDALPSLSPRLGTKPPSTS